MTVCVATISSSGAIFGASDRMLSVKDYMEFEPGGSKIFAWAGLPIAIMWAGHSALMAEVLSGLADARAAWGATAGPDDLWPINAVALAYQDAFAKAKRRWAASHVLAPLGVELDSILDPEGPLSPELAQYLSEKMTQYELPDGVDVEIIIAGRDAWGSHLWAAQNVDIQCFDIAGYAAIGVGGVHATSQLMSAGFDKSKAPGEAFVLTHVAKKRAEVAPGVGTATDMFAVSFINGRWSQNPILTSLVEDLDKKYDAMRGREREALALSVKDVEKQVQAAAIAAPPAPESPNNPTISESDQT